MNCELRGSQTSTQNLELSNILINEISWGQVNKPPLQTTVEARGSNVKILANVCGAVDTCGPDDAVCAQANGNTVSPAF